jgi:hypothetical protein
MPGIWLNVKIIDLAAMIKEYLSEKNLTILMINLNYGKKVN